MPTNTEGFGVNVMPTYTPVDTSLVAFNPSAFSSGIGQGMSLVDKYNKIRADEAAYQELAATRQDRIAAANALSGITVNTAPGQIGATNARNAATSLVAPVQADFDVSKIGFDKKLLEPNSTFNLKDISARLGRQDNENEVKSYQAIGGAQRALGEEELKAQDLEMRKTALAAKALQDPKSAELLLKTTEQELHDYKAKAALKLEQLSLANDLASATAFYHEAQGNALNAKSLAGPKGIDPVAAINKIDTAIANIDRQPVGMLDDQKKPVTTAAYEPTVVDPATGKPIIKEPSLLRTIGNTIMPAIVDAAPDQPARSDIGDKNLKTRNDLIQLRSFYQQMLAPTPQVAPAAPAAPVAPVVPAVATPTPTNNPIAKFPKDSTGAYIIGTLADGLNFEDGVTVKSPDGFYRKIDKAKIRKQLGIK